MSSGALPIVFVSKRPAPFTTQNPTNKQIVEAQRTTIFSWIFILLRFFATHEQHVFALSKFVVGIQLAAAVSHSVDRSAFVCSLSLSLALSLSVPLMTEYTRTVQMLIFRAPRMMWLAAVFASSPQTAHYATLHSTLNGRTRLCLPLSRYFQLGQSLIAYVNWFPFLLCPVLLLLLFFFSCFCCSLVRAYHTSIFVALEMLMLTAAAAAFSSSMNTFLLFPGLSGCLCSNARCSQRTQCYLLCFCYLLLLIKFCFALILWIFFFAAAAFFHWIVHSNGGETKCSSHIHRRCNSI